METLIELVRAGHSVQIEDHDLGYRVVVIQHPNGFEAVYEGKDLAALLARAHAGEPSGSGDGDAWVRL